jgi:hypothetical protein
MEELSKKNKVEISVKKQKQLEHELIGKIQPFSGHRLWEINNETLEIELAKFSTVKINWGSGVRKEIITMKGFSYISALNKKSALKKFHKGINGSKPALENPIQIQTF